jgi:hypothetical protein
MRIRLGLGGDKVRLADMQLRRILNNEDRRESPPALWRGDGRAGRRR